MANLSSFFGGGGGVNYTTKLADDALEFLLAGPSEAETDAFFAAPARKAGLAIAVSNPVHFTPLFETPEPRASLIQSAAAMEAIGQSFTTLDALNGAPDYVREFIFDGPVPMARLAGSLNAMAVVAEHEPTMLSIRNSATAMGAMAASQIAMDAIVASPIAYEAVVGSSVATNAIAASQIAMDAVVAASAGARSAFANSSFAMNSIMGSELARDTVINSPAMRSSMVVSSTAMNAAAASTPFTTALLDNEGWVDACFGSNTAIDALFNAQHARVQCFNDPAIESKMRNSATVMNRLSSQFATALSVETAGNLYALLTSRNCFVLSAHTGYNSSIGFRGARSFRHFQDGVDATQIEVPNNNFSNGNWPLLTGRMMSGLHIMARSGSTITYTRSAEVVYMD